MFNKENIIMNDIYNAVRTAPFLATRLYRIVGRVSYTNGAALAYTPVGKATFELGKAGMVHVTAKESVLQYLNNA